MSERDLKKHLRDLAAAVTEHLATLDAEMNEPDSLERGKRIALSANALDFANDRVRYFALGIDYRKDDKPSNARLLMAGASRSETNERNKA